MNGANPILGVIFHWIGGLAAASFYIPYRGVKRWSWETYWLAGGFFSWIIAPSVAAMLLVPDVQGILRQAFATHPSALIWAYIFGIGWGFGGLTFGLTMRYLGIALGMAVALGYCTVFGTLIPPIVNGSIGAIAASNSGHFILLGMLFCVIGIAVSGLAGMKKEKELDDEQKKATIKEFNFVKGMLIATFSGIMSSCMAYGIAAGKPVASIAMQHLSAVGGLDLWKNLPTMIVVLLGGFTTNVIWCLILSFNNRSFPEYFGIVKASADEPSSSSPAPIKTKAPLLNNYVFSALAGITWYLQFFFYSMGTVKMGAYDFSSWTLHMASIIIFSSIWGIALHEWKGSSKKTFNVLFAGIGVLVFSTVVVGYGNYIQKGEQDKAKAKAVSISIPARGLIRQSEAPVYFHGKS